MDLLPIYVEDHLALSLAGIRLARRCRDENRGSALGRYLERLVPELEEDRAVLAHAARALGSGPSLVKDAAAALGEWLGRLKPNGRIVGYSELSRLWELEALAAGTASRHALWKVLGRAARRDARVRGFDFERLEERALRHRAELERHRVRAADVAFAAARPGAARAGLGAPAHAR
jgi:hypothetical protein